MQEFAKFKLIIETGRRRVRRRAGEGEEKKRRPGRPQKTKEAHEANLAVIAAAVVDTPSFVLNVKIVPLRLGGKSAHPL